MKKSSLLKTIVVIGLSLILVANLVSVVRAADDNSFSDWTNPTVTENTTTTTPTTTTTTDNTVSNTVNNTTVTSNTTNSISTDITTNTSSSGTTNSTITTGNATTTLNTSTNNSENEVNTLAYTGIENNSLLVVVILVGAIVAGYSFKKVREYNNI